MDLEPAKKEQRKQLPSERYCVFILPRIYNFSLFSSFTLFRVFYHQFLKLQLLNIGEVDETMDKLKILSKFRRDWEQHQVQLLITIRYHPYFQSLFMSHIH
ncbi:hypothetical protein Hanom_Chr04g00375981 [Helianthus anomalus]